MMRSMTVVLTLVVLGVSGSSFAASAAFPEIAVLQDHLSSTTIEFELPGYDLAPVDADGIPCTRIIVPGQVTFLKKGLPELPTIARNIIISDDGLMDFRIIDVEYETRDIGTIVPSKGSISRSVDPSTIPYTFDRLYETDSWWPQNTVELYEPFILRDYRGITVRFNPFQYNPVQGKLRIAKRVVVEVYESGKGGANILHKRRGSINKEFVNIYQSIFLNFSPARYDSISEHAGRMLIITADAYNSNMQPFVDWKMRKGIYTKMLNISAIGNNETAIKNRIQAEYDSTDLVWVLFIGDGNEVVPATGTIGWAAGEDADPVYAYTAGTDYYPDLFISRFSSRSGNSVNIDKQVKRSIDYERQPMAEADWYHIGLGVASNLTGGTGYADSTRMNWLRDSLLLYHYTTVNKSYDPYGTSALIKSYIEAGTGIINYIGHGNTSGWGNGGGFSIGDINNLNNPWMLPFVISVACLVGNFNGADCYCENSVTAGEVNQPDGFVVHWGSSIDQHWVEPCLGQEGAINLLTHDKKNTAGGIFFNGACYMIEYFAADPFAVDMAQTWTIFGDASLQLRSTTPDTMNVVYNATTPPAPNSFTVTVKDNDGVTPLANALVCCWIANQSPEMHVSDYTNASGTATLTINPTTTGDTMYVTVTDYNYIPHEGYALVVSLSGPYVTLGTTIVDDAGGNGQVNPGETIDLGVWAKNVGVDTAFSVYGLLSTTDTYATITVDSSSYGDIAPDDSLLSDPYYTFTVAEDCPNNHGISFDLVFHDDDGNTWTSYPSVTVYAPVLTYQEVSVVNDNNSNGILEPGETADLVVTLENEGGAVAENVTSTLLTSSAFITINDATGNFGTIDPGDTATNATDPFNVTADSATPVGTVVGFEIEVVSGISIDTLAFDLVVGKKHYYVWNPDLTPTPGQNIHSTLTELGYTGDYGTTLTPDLNKYQSVFVCVGIFTSNYIITNGSPEAIALVDFLQNQGGCMYLEGGDVWYWDPSHGGYDFGPLFGIDATDDGAADLFTVEGLSGTYTQGMNFGYGGENNYIDHICPTGTGYLIFRNAGNNDSIGVANNAGTYRTVGTSFELGLLNDGTSPSTRAALLDSIMKFFGIGPEVGIEEDEELTGVPLRTTLGTLYPNPFYHRLVIRYQIAESDMAGNISLKIYDATGRLIRDFSQALPDIGYRSSIIWDGKDDVGRAVPAGVYFVHFATNEYQRVEKAILLR